ncbi:hypothetical protein [Bradyrhizobium cenepequi]|jgi:hypothetical protein
MRALWFAATAALFVTTCPALAESTWLQSGQLEASEVKVLCERATDVRLLARMQMIASGNDRWRRLSRQGLVVEAVAMGVRPLDPDRCYVIARAGLADEKERRAFEVRDFFDSIELTSVFVLGRVHDQPAGELSPQD